MTITKYRVSKLDGYVEFTLESDAISFANENDISLENISIIEETIPEVIY